MISIAAHVMLAVTLSVGPAIAPDPDARRALLRDGLGPALDSQAFSRETASTASDLLGALARERLAVQVAADAELLAKRAPLSALGGIELPDSTSEASLDAAFSSAEAARKRVADLLGGFAREGDAKRAAEALAAAASELQLRMRNVSDASLAASASLRRRLERPTALVVAGGVSLGSYQAGFLHYYTQYLLAYEKFLKGLDGRLDSSKVGRFNIGTGASAGSINSFLALIAGCREPVKDPEKSLFFRTWVPVGMEDLFDEKSVQSNALLSRSPIEAAIARMKGLWDKGDGWRTDAPCEALLGMSVTPLQRRAIAMRPARDPNVPVEPPDLVVHRASEKFMFKLRPGVDARPVFQAFQPKEPAGFYPLYGDGSTSTFGVTDVMPLFRASSSFPVAFEPIPITFTVSGKTETREFIDGGVFDNTPLRLAVRMHRWQQNAVKAAATPAVVPDDPWLLFVEPDAIGWTPKAGGSADAQGDGIFDVYGPFLTNFVAAARRAELMETFESDSGLARRLVMPTRLMPVASSQLSAFLGFFDRDFRVFDFYMGMADARTHLASYSDQFREMTASGGSVAVTSKVFDCFAEYRDRAGTVQNLRTELPACAALNVDAPGECGRIGSSGESDPVCPKNMLALLEASAQLKNELVTGKVTPAGETERFFALLRAGGYRFRTMSAGDGDGAALSAIRERLEEGIERLGDKQSTFTQKAGVLVGGKAAANAWRYRPPRGVTSVAVQLDRGFEVGYAHQLVRLGRISVRAGAAARLFQFEELQLGGSGGQVFALSVMPAASLSLDIPLGNKAQLEPGLGYGVLFREGYYPVSHLMLRHGPELSLSLTFLQRLYVQAGMTQFLDDCEDSNRCVEVASRWRSRPNPITTHERDYRLAIGWRFLQ